jgi:hypothetical protein
MAASVAIHAPIRQGTGRAAARTAFAESTVIRNYPMRSGGYAVREIRVGAFCRRRRRSVARRNPSAAAH